MGKTKAQAQFGKARLVEGETNHLTEEDWDLRQNIAFRMSCVLSRLDQELRDAVLRNMNLTFVRFRVLQVLYDQDGQMIGELARLLVLRQPALSRVVDQMEERDLVVRRPKPENNRYIHVWLTAVGRETYEKVWPASHRIIEKALTVVTLAERKLLLDMLLRMDAHLQK